MFIEVQVYAKRHAHEADAARATAAVEAWVAAQYGRIEALLQEEIEAECSGEGEGFSPDWAEVYCKMHAIAFAAATEGWDDPYSAEVLLIVEE